MAGQADMWCGTVEQVGPDGFVVALLGDEGVVTVDKKIMPGVRVGMIATFYTFGDVDEDGNKIVECDIADPKEELPN